LPWPATSGCLGQWNWWIDESSGPLPPGPFTLIWAAAHPRLGAPGYSAQHSGKRLRSARRGSLVLDKPRTAANRANLPATVELPEGYIAVQEDVRDSGAWLSLRSSPRAETHRRSSILTAEDLAAPVPRHTGEDREHREKGIRL